MTLLLETNRALLADMTALRSRMRATRYQLRVTIMEARRQRILSMAARTDRMKGQL
jgi:hypothetical protein